MKEQMFQAEMLNQQLKQIEEQLNRAEQQHADMRSLQEALDQFKKLKSGEEMLVPLSAGIFAKATFTGSPELLVNVGQGVLTSKNPDDIHEHIENQIAGLEEFQQELRKKFEELLTELNTLKETFKP